MHYSEKLQQSFYLLLLIGLTGSCPSLAQSTVLTGSINQSIHRPRIVTADAGYSPASLPTTSVRIQPGSLQSLTASQDWQATQVLAPANARPVPQPQLQSGTTQAMGARKILYVDRPVFRTVYVRDNRTFFQKHPKVKSAAVGAGVGAGVGALGGLLTHRGVMRGALIGGGAGAGVGLLRSSAIMKRHPIIRNVSTGSLMGLGLGAVISRGHRTPLLGTGLGAAVGLGASLLNGEFK